MPDEKPTITLLGVKLPIPSWSVTWFGIIALGVVLGMAYRYFYPKPDDLVSLKQANAQLQTSVQEFGRHMAETPENTFTDPDGAFLIKSFADHCVLIVRRLAHDKVLTKLIPDLALDGPRTALAWPTFTAALSAQGRCLNPHPGQFGTAYGARNGCWLEVWRAWPDGCQHVQLINTCAGGIWDTNPDGSPRVRWTSCRH